LITYDVIIIGAGAAGRGNSSHELNVMSAINQQEDFVDNVFERFFLYEN